MRPPARWKESSGGDPLARALIRSAPRTRTLSAEQRQRGASFATSLALVPLLGVALWSKSVAAAFGAGFAGALALVTISPEFRGWLAPDAPAEAPAVPLAAARPRAAGALPARSEQAPAAAHAPELGIETESRLVAPLAAMPPRVEQSPRTPAAHVPDAASERAGRAPAADGRLAPPEPSVDVPAIAAEVELVMLAKSLLGTDAPRALLVLDQHRQRFPSGSLAAEREVLTVDALSRSGQRAAAIQRARALLDDARNAFYAARLKQLLGTLLDRE